MVEPLRWDLRDGEIPGFKSERFDGGAACSSPADTLSACLGDGESAIPLPVRWIDHRRGTYHVELPVAVGIYPVRVFRRLADGRTEIILRRSVEIFDGGASFSREIDPKDGQPEGSWRDRPAMF